MARVGVISAIILHAYLVHVNALSIGDFPYRTDTRELTSAPPLSTSQIRNDQTDPEQGDEHSVSRLLSSLAGDFRGEEKPAHPQIQSTQQSESQDSYSRLVGQKRADEGAVDEVEEDAEEEGEDGEKRQLEREKDERYENSEEEKDENYGKRRENDRERSEVHLFERSGVRLRDNLKGFKQQQDPRRLHFGTLNSPDLQKFSSNLEIVRLERPRSNANGYSYMHPEEWSLDNPECSGNRQSPVNVDSEQLIDLDLPTSLIWTGYWDRPNNLTITDNGHAVQLSGSWKGEATPFITGGPLEGEYLFAQLHFHWGSTDSVGSEHTVNNKRFPMEMHMVHYKRDYGTLQEALKYDDGLAVVALLFEIGETSNDGINLLENSLSKVQNEPRVGVPVEPYPLALLHFKFDEDYVSYFGSLTTPPCREVVTWLVSSRPLAITREQLESFRKISNKWPGKKNYRPIQELHGRRLYYITE